MIPFCQNCLHNPVGAYEMHLCCGCAKLRLSFAQAMTVENSFSVFIVAVDVPPSGSKVQIGWTDYLKAYNG